MKKVNLKKVLSFVVVSILILIKIFCIWDSKTSNFSINYYEGAENTVNFLLCFAIIYILFGIYELFKNSIIVGILDFITSASLVVMYFCFDNDVLSNILLIIAIIITIINLVASIIIRKNNLKNKDNVEGKESISNKSNSLKEILISVAIFVVLTCVAFVPMYNSSKGIKENAQKLANNISSFEIDDTIYVMTESDPDTGDVYNVILNKEFERLKEFNEDTYTLSFAKIYKNNKYYLIGLLKDKNLNKSYLVNSKMEEVCEIDKVGEPNYLGEYLLDVLNSAINSNIINYEYADTRVYDINPPQKALLYLEKDFDGKKYETDSNFEYKYFENEMNSDYLIQVAYNKNMINPNDTNIMEQLFGYVYTNIDAEENLYDLEREYYFINLKSNEKYKLECDNLLFDEYAKKITIDGEEKELAGFYSFSDGEIPYFDETNYGYFDLNGKKHVDTENRVSIDTYENYDIVYDKEKSQYFVYSKSDSENAVKEYEYICTYDNYIIGLNNEKYEILNPKDLTVLKDVTMKGYKTEEDAEISEDTEDSSDTEITEDIDEAEEIEEIEETEFDEEADVTDDIDEVSVSMLYSVTFMDGEVILLRNKLTNEYTLLHYNSDNKKIEIISENVREFEAIDRSQDRFNNFYYYSNIL